MPLAVPLQAVPSQILTVNLANQPVQLAIYQKQSGLYMDVAVNNSPVINGVLCENRNRIVRSAYLGFQGDFAFNDTQGTSDPEYSALGTRYQLLYLTAAEDAELP